MKTAFRHPNPKLQSLWNYTQLGLLIFPVSPFFGAVILGLVALVTWAIQYRTIINHPLNWGFALLSVLLIITASFAYDKPEAFLGLSNFFPYFIFFTAFGCLIQTTAQLRQLSWILVITSIPVIIIGFGQLFLGWATPPQGWISFLGWAITPGGEPPGRMASVFMYANILAGYLTIVFILGLGLWLESYQQFRRQGSQGEQGRQGSKFNFVVPSLPFLFLTLAVVGNFIALILTNSRNAWAIAIFACLAYALYEGWRLLVASVAGVTASVLLAAFAPSPISQLFRRVVPAFFWARLNDQLYPDRPVALLRKTQWEFAWSMAQQRPWTGWGLRNFTKLYEAKMQIWLGHPHNFFLMLVAETGFPTTIIFCGLLCWLFVDSVQLLRKSKLLQTEDRLLLFSYLLVFTGWILFNTVDVSLFDVRLNALWWLLLAAISGVVYRYNRYIWFHSNQEDV